MKRLSWSCLLACLCLASCQSQQLPAPITEGWNQPTRIQSHHIVDKNETLYSIAWAYNKDFQQLADINGISAPYTIRQGQHIALVGEAKHETQGKLSVKKIASRGNKSAGNLSNVNVKRVVIAKKRSQGAQYQWVMPAKGHIIQRFDAKHGKKGIDIAATLGSSIVAVQAGKVVYSGKGLRGYGNLLIIKHRNSLLSAYAHNKALLVTEGEQVQRGQRVATMGRDGSGNVLLHFEVRRNGQPVDPQQFIH